MRPNTLAPLLGFIALLALANAPLARAQSVPVEVNSANATGIQPYNVYGGARENINLSNGNLNLQIPLLTLPGRNGHDLNLYLTYDSKIWNLRYIRECFYEENSGTWDCTPPPDWEWFSEIPSPPLAEGGSGAAPGWRLSLPVLQWDEHNINDSSLSCTTFVVTMPDGSKHPFGNRAECYQDFGSGPQRVASQDIHITDSDDASYMRLDTTSLSNIVLHLKDGTRMHFFAWPTFGSQVKIADKIVDPNGNVVTIQSDCTQHEFAKLLSITDTLGRVVSFNWSGSVFPYISSISYKDSSGTTQSISFTYNAAIGDVSFTSPSPAFVFGAAPLPDTITFPNGLAYRFEYNAFGELTKISYPTGGYTRYDWGLFYHLWMSRYAPDVAIDFRQVVARHVCDSPVGSCAQEFTTTYTPTVDGTKSNNQFMDVRDPDANRTRHEFAFVSARNYAFSPRELRRLVYQGESTLLRTIETTYDQFNPHGLPSSRSLPTVSTTTLNDSGQVTKTEWTYDTYTAAVCPLDAINGTTCTPQTMVIPIDNPTEVREFHYGAGAPGSLARKTVNTWLKGNYHSTSIHILDRKLSEKIYDAAGVLKAQSDFEYDNYTEGISLSGAVQHDPAFGTGYTTRGNLTAVLRWRNSPAATLTTRHQYDDAGNLRKTTDPLTHNTTFSYTDSWANSACTPVGGSAKGYLTSATNHLNQTTTSTYHSCSGAAATTTDPNLRTSTFTYDLMSRLTVTDLPDGGQATNTYNEAAMPLSVTRSAKITPSMNVTAPTDVDGLGRVTQTRLTSDPQGTVFTDTTYDALGRKNTVSNPYRSTSDPTYGLTTFEYDALGRVTKVIPPDGSSASNNVSTTYSGNCTTVTDQAGKKRKSCTDALGRLIEVWEPDAAGAFIYQTVYTYDVLDNLSQVQQKGNDSNPANWRTRTFAYNSLSQLTQAVNPESGAITYTYDNDGNLLTKTAPKPNQTGALTVTTTYTYDALHRLTQKSYNDGSTPAVTYFYDQSTYNNLTINNGIGRRTGMADAAGQEAWSYDVMGRVLTNRRTTNAVTKEFTYTYNLDGSLGTLTYPSGRVITYISNAAGRTLSAVDTANSINYATNASYAAHGALATLRHHSTAFTWRERSFTYNNRLQPVTINVSNVFTRVGTELRKTAYQLTYDFGHGSANNGNVLSIARLPNNLRNQSFTYDHLNRLLTAQSAATSGEDCWGQSYEYDPWGNLHHMNVTQCSAPMLALTINPNNRIASFCYDAAGNLLRQAACAPTNDYTYDAENRLTTTAGVTYAYDGDGKRVKKSNGTLYWHGGGGDTLMETDLAGTLQDEYVFFNGQRIARRAASGTVYYFFSDHLGSSRIVTDSAGTVVEDSDFYPFGAERVVLDNLNNNYKFTGQERDSESGLDYFIARHYAFTLARFLQPDEFTGGPVELFAEMAAANPTFYADLVNPQSLNKYSYVYNNPLHYVDPDGHAGVDIANSIDAAVNNAVASIENTLIATGAPTVAAQGSFLVGVAADVVKGTADVLRLGEGGANAVDAAKDGDYQGAAVEAAKEGGRVGGVILAVVGAAGALKGAGPAPEASAAPKTATGAALPDSVPASKGAGPPTAAERAAVNEIGNTTGCHTCGAKTPGTKSGNWVADHQPPKALGKPKVLKPHCMSCSRRQGGQVGKQVRKQKKTQNAGKRAGE